ncbi:MAG: nucleoside-triphosphatase [Bacillota bacterium]
MPQPLHILLTGEIGAGKSTLARRLLAHSERPLYGFVTLRQPPDADNIARTCIYPVNAAERICSDANTVGFHDGKAPTAFPAVFDSLGVALLQAPKEGLLLMDELGFYESAAIRFQQEVLRALDGDTPVLAVVKQRETPFLDEVRAHKNARLFTVTAEARDALYEELLPLVLQWNTY